MRRSGRTQRVAEHARVADGDARLLAQHLADHRRERLLDGALDRQRERLEIDAMRAARREDHEVAVAVAGAADEVGGIEHRAAQAIEHRGGVVVDLAVMRDAEIELDAMQARQIDEQARQRAIAR